MSAEADDDASAVVEGLRAELAELREDSGIGHYESAITGKCIACGGEYMQCDGFMAEIIAGEAALRAAGGQEKPEPVEPIEVNDDILRQFGLGYYHGFGRYKGAGQYLWISSIEPFRAAVAAVLHLAAAPVGGQAEPTQQEAAMDETPISVECNCPESGHRPECGR